MRKGLLESFGQPCEGSLFAVLLVLVVVPLRIAQHLAEQRDDHSVAKRQVRFQDVDVILLCLLRLLCILFVLLLGSDFPFQAFFIPERGPRELLGAVYGDGITACYQIAQKLLAANQMPDHIQMRLFNLVDFDLLQDPGQCVMMRQIFEFRKESAQIGHEHRAGHLPGCFPPRGHLKGKT